MARPKSDRMVFSPPLYEGFRPMSDLSVVNEKITLTLDEYEAIRLADLGGLIHEVAAEEMDISRSTFTRLIENARKKMADFLVNGKNLVIEGGHIHFKHNIIRCLGCGQVFKIRIGRIYSACPECASTSLINLAKGFGHGYCCMKGNIAAVTEK